LIDFYKKLIELKKNNIFKFLFRTLDESYKTFFYQTVGYQTKSLNKL